MRWGNGLCEKEGVILRIEPLTSDSERVRVVVKPNTLDGERWNDHAILNVEDDLFVSLECNYSIITTLACLSETLGVVIHSNNIESVYGMAIIFYRYRMDVNTALKEIVIHSFRKPQSRTICRNKLRVDYEWLYISRLEINGSGQNEEDYRKQIISFLKQSYGKKYKIGNFRSQAMKFTRFTDEEKYSLYKAMEEARHSQWTLRTHRKLLFHNKFSRCSDYSFEYNYVILADNAFAGFYNLEHITIPKTVKYIGNRCFANCSKLTDIHLSQNLISIGMRCFTDCIALQHIVLPNSVTDIESLAFCNCKALKEVVISDNLEHIGWNVFDGCSSELKIIVNKEHQDKLMKVLYSYKENVVLLDSEYIRSIIEIYR